MFIKTFIILLENKITFIAVQKKLNVFHHLFADISHFKKNTRSKEKRDNELFQSNAVKNIFSTENPIKFKGKDGLIKNKEESS